MERLSPIPSQSQGEVRSGAVIVGIAEHDGGQKLAVPVGISPNTAAVIREALQRAREENAAARAERLADPHRVPPDIG